MKAELSDKIHYISKLFYRELSVKEVSEALGLTTRQVYNLLNKYEEQGVKGLVHGSVGKTGHNSCNEEQKIKILNFVKNKYFDCGPTLASEMLEETEGIQVHRETLRLWMKEAGLINKMRKRKPYRQRRPRKEGFGEMLQIDGSFHQWFSAQKTCLINLIDDATNQNMCLFDEQETSAGAALLLWKWIQKYGIPQSIYCDRRNAYFMGDDKYPSGFFGTLCKSLKIKVIAANSPQAKGRVERSNRTHQERLIPKLKMREITTIEQANKYLFANYLPHHNKRFAIDYNILENKHSPISNPMGLDDFCFIEHPRKVNNDMTVSFQGSTLQILRKNYCPPKSTVIVRFFISGKFKIFFKNHSLDFKILS